MKSFLSMTLFLFIICAVMAQSGELPVYNGTDLGYVYTKKETRIRVYAPLAEKLRFRLYSNGSGGKALKELYGQRGESGTWTVVLPGDQKGRFYSVQAMHDGNWGLEVTEPYAWSVGVNGNRVQVIDMRDTDPAGWSKDESPAFTSDNGMQDAVIYETHLRDISVHGSSGIKNKGRYLGLTERGTRNKAGHSTGLDHIRELGVTHVHLLPVFDYNSVDESRPANKAYNWGYDPKNYNVPEGSYSSNAADGAVRIREFKQMVAAMHQAGLRVVMDVVYNHTALSKESNFHQLVPGYYHRMKGKDLFADASACGNETASEKPMMRKFMRESLEHWVKEYHIDGFRFDLMAIHDMETMNEISAALQKIKPDILLYGEGWAAASPALEESRMSFKRYAGRLNRIAVFSDDIRDAIKGYVFDEKARGFVNGNPAMKETILFGVTGALGHPQIDTSRLFYDKKPYAKAAAQVINYVDCHDNLALWDKLAVSAPEADKNERTRMQQMAYGLIITSQGIPFIHAGSEFLRSKYGVENSYNSPDSINAINWDLKTENISTVRFIRELLALRRKHPIFRLRSAEQVRDQIRFLQTGPEVMAYQINRANERDSWSKCLVIANAGKSDAVLSIPDAGNWKLAVFNGQHKTEAGTISVGALSFIVLFQE